MGLYIANSLFLGDYLTSEGQPGGEDLQMIADAGLEILQMDGGEQVSRPAAAVAAVPATPASQEKKVAIRTRGAGTSEPANA